MNGVERKVKLEWRKHFKNLYLPPQIPVKIHVPPMNYLTIEGKGNPNQEGFRTDVEALYTLSYSIRMLPKKGVTPEGFVEYTVFPLEGIWDLDEEGRKMKELNKDHLIYKLMIRQPEFVTEDLFQKVLETSRKKKPDLPLERVKFETWEDGLCVQMMHVGSYDEEPKTFRVMEQFCKDENLVRTDLTHKEIYITDPRKTSPENAKTVLRFQVAEAKRT